MQGVSYNVYFSVRFYEMTTVRSLLWEGLPVIEAGWPNCIDSINVIANGVVGEQPYMYQKKCKGMDTDIFDGLWWVKNRFVWNGDATPFI